MSGLGAIRTELAQLVTATTGLPCYDYVPLDPDPPAAYVGWPLGLNYAGSGLSNRTANGAVGFEIPVTFVVGLAAPHAGQRRVDDLMSIDLPAAINAHTPTSWITATASRLTEPTPDPEARALLVDLVVSVRALLT